MQLKERISWLVGTSFQNIITAAAIMILWNTSIAFGALVTVTSSGSKTFNIHGSQMSTVSGIEMNLSYDTSSLSSPTVTQGSLVSDALLAANTSNPGTIKIAIIGTKAFSDSGQIATVTFATRNGSGGITAASVHMINVKTEPIAAQISVSNENATSAPTIGFTSTPGVPFSQPDTTSTSITAAASSSSTTAATTVSSIPTYLGSVSMPADTKSNDDKKAVEITSIPAQLPEPIMPKPVDPSSEAKTNSEPHKPQKVTITSHKGILDIFRANKEVKTPGGFIALFNKEIAPAIRQEPTIALSDGKTPIIIIVRNEITGVKSPNFALNGAKLVSLSKDAATSAWVIKALPLEGVVQASLSIMTDSNTIEYPLTLATPVESVTTSLADFVIFLSDRGATSPKYDFNKDKKHDYLDDFIYTTNYIVKKNAAEKKQ